MTVHQLLSSLDSAELTEWRAHFLLEAAESNTPAPQQTERSEEDMWRTAFNAW